MLPARSDCRQSAPPPLPPPPRHASARTPSRLLRCDAGGSEAWVYDNSNFFSHLLASLAPEERSTVRAVWEAVAQLTSGGLGWTEEQCSRALRLVGYSKKRFHEERTMLCPLSTEAAAHQMPAAHEATQTYEFDFLDRILKL